MMTPRENESHIAADEYERPESTSRWPFFVGTIAILYGVLGVFVNVVMALATLIGPWLGSAFAGIDPIPMPPAIVLGQLILVICLVGVGLLLIVSGVATLRRRRSGPRGINMWIIMRLILLIVGVLFTAVTLQGNVDWQLASQDIVRDAIRQNGTPEDQVRKMMPPTDAETIRSQTIIATLAFTGMLAVCPITLGVVLSSKRIHDEWVTWS